MKYLIKFASLSCTNYVNCIDLRGWKCSVGKGYLIHVHVKR